MKDPYRELAAYYDLMAEDPAIKAIYHDFRAALRQALRVHGVRSRVIVDLACGTGNTAVPWASDRRRTVIGVDRSEAMLSVARRKSARVRWVRQEATSLRLDVSADVVTCHFDALNHVLDPADLQRIFGRVADTLRPGGLFLFDLNTRYFLEWLSTSEKLFRAGPHSFTAYNEFNPRTGVATFHQLWFVKRGRLYRKFEVSLCTRAFDDALLRRMLRAAGLRVEDVTVLRRLKGRPIRKLYLAVKSSAPITARRRRHP